jgi:hypothetical protein
VLLSQRSALNGPRSFSRRSDPRPGFGASTRYKTSEADLIEILQQVDQHRVYLEKGHSSLFAYVVQELGLSESVAYNLISVSRKAREVPELQQGLRDGTITLSNARKVAPVLNTENQGEWLKKAQDLSHRQLEKEIARVKPETLSLEKVKYVTGSRTQLQVGLSERDLLELRRAQDLLCQARGRSVTLEEVIVTVTQEYLKRQDPVERARRHRVKKGTTSAPASIPSPSKNPKPRREFLPAAVLHEVHFRDQRRCAHVNAQGKRCNQTRWLEIHHIHPVSQGGLNTPDNLITLCSGHHDWTHAQQAKRTQPVARQAF